MDYQLVIPEGYVKLPVSHFNEWIAALRSGNFPQGQMALCENGKYCCLGVLAKIQNRLIYNEDVETWGDQSNHNGYLSFDNPFCSVSSAEGYFPKGVYIDSEKRLIKSLAEMNDSNFGFADIADVTEQLYCEPT